MSKTFSFVMAHSPKRRPRGPWRVPGHPLAAPAIARDDARTWKTPPAARRVTCPDFPPRKPELCLGLQRSQSLFHRPIVDGGKEKGGFDLAVLHVGGKGFRVA